MDAVEVEQEMRWLLTKASLGMIFLRKRKRERGKTCQKDEPKCKQNIKLIQAQRLHEQLDFPIAGFPPAHKRWWLSGTFHRPVQVFVSSCILIKSLILVTGEGERGKLSITHRSLRLSRYSAISL